MSYGQTSRKHLEGIFLIFILAAHMKIFWVWVLGSCCICGF